MQAFISHPLEPVYDCDSRILILGTMPSVKSRKAGFYYMHPQNRFWPVLSEVLDEPFPVSVQEKRAMVLRHHIALWDVLESCEINGSLDGTIRNPKANDFSLLFTTASIRAVFTTGNKATDLYRRLVKHVADMDCVALPSTSPANRSISDAMLRKSFRVILPYLHPDHLS